MRYIQRTLLLNTLVCFCCICKHIPGDPGASSRDERYFRCESLLQKMKSPWDLLLTKRVPGVARKIFFSRQWTTRSSRVIISPSYTKWFSSSIDLVAWPMQREVSSWRVSEKKRFNDDEEIANRNMGTLPLVFLVDLSKVYRKFV